MKKITPGALCAVYAALICTVFPLVVWAGGYRCIAETKFIAYIVLTALFLVTADFDLTALCRAAGNDMMQELNERYLSTAGEEKREAAYELCAYAAEHSSLIPLVFERRVYYRRQGASWDFEPTWTDPFRAMAARPAE